MILYDNYKDSGIEWLGQIPEYWSIIRLKYLCNIETGDKDTIDADDEGLYPFFVRSQTVEKINSYTKDCEAVLTAGDGVGVGKVFHYINGKFDFHQRVYMFNKFRQIRGKYFFTYLANNFYKVVLDGNAKNTVDSLRLPQISNFIFTVPPICEQHEIINYLDQQTSKIDELIRKQNRLIELLQEKKKSLINHVVTKGLNPNVPMKDSGIEWLGQIPAHWEVKRTKSIFRLIIEPAPVNNQQVLLSLYTDIGVSPRSELEERGNKASSTDGYLLVRKGDIVVNKLLAWMGAVGVSNYDGVTSPAYDIIRPFKRISVKFYHYLFRDQTFVQEMKRYSRGIMDMRLRLYFDKFGEISLPIPIYQEQLDIVQYIETRETKIDELINKAKSMIELLKEHKSSLINNVITGKMKVVE